MNDAPLIMETISASDRIYREFTCWVARRSAKIAGLKTDFEIVLVVEQYLRGSIDLEEVKAARAVAIAGTVGAIGAAATIGTRVRGARAASVKVLYLISPSAAAHLAASCCADDSARQAADRAIQYGALTARNANKWNRSAEGQEREILKAELKSRLEKVVLGDTSSDSPIP